MEVNATDGVGFSIVFVLFLFFVLVTPLTASAASQPLGKSAAITGKLEVRLMGCQDLLEDVPGRSRRDSTHSAPNDLKSFVKGALKVIRKHSGSIPRPGDLNGFEMDPRRLGHLFKTSCWWIQDDCRWIGCGS